MQPEQNASGALLISLTYPCCHCAIASELENAKDLMYRLSLHFIMISLAGALQVVNALANSLDCIGLH